MDDAIKSLPAMLLFLDFDGVLHPFAARASAAQFAYLPRLESVLRDFPAVQVVITSTQREDRALDDLRQIFSPDIAARVAGVAPVLPLDSAADLAGIRFREIGAYLDALPARVPWIALDDDATLFPADCPNLILCADGFDVREAAALYAALAAAERRVTTQTKMI